MTMKEPISGKFVSLRTKPVNISTRPLFAMPEEPANLPLMYSLQLNPNIMDGSNHRLKIRIILSRTMALPITELACILPGEMINRDSTPTQRIMPTYLPSGTLDTADS